MIRLTREIRFSLAADVDGRSPLDGSVINSWGGWPHAVALAPYLRLRCTVMGQPDPVTGYVCNVKLIDEVVRQYAVRTAFELYQQLQGSLTIEHLLGEMWRVLEGNLPPVAPLVRLELRATPTLHYSLAQENLDMIQITQQFEFSAAHRLHCAELSDEENLDRFGKCNNRYGHGHNYLLEVTVKTPRQKSNDSAFPLSDFEQTVKQLVVDRFDHKHLNEDTEEFRSLNPTVENIADTIWSLLDGQLSPGVLDCVRVYETPKTWVECRGA